MADASMKKKGLLLQLAGFIILLISLNGFFFLTGTVLYFPGLLAGVIIFAVCLFRGGSLVKQSKEQKPPANG
jgi:hypothetical protein